MRKIERERDLSHCFLSYFGSEREGGKIKDFSRNPLFHFIPYNNHYKCPFGIQI